MLLKSNRCDKNISSVSLVAIKWNDVIYRAHVTTNQIITVYSPKFSQAIHFAFLAKNDGL